MVIVDAKLELRDSTSWDTLDRAIKRVGGVAAAAVEGNGKGVSTAAHAPDALSPRDSDDEDSTGVSGLRSGTLGLSYCPAKQSLQQGNQVSANQTFEPS